MASTLNADNGSLSGSSGLKGSGDASGVLALQTNGTTALTIDTSQNVGIGTSSPSAKLDIQSSTASEAKITATSAAGSGNYSGYRAVNGGGNISVFGTGTTAGSYTYTGELSNSAFVGSFSNTPLQFVTNSTARVTVDTSGNVGIGTIPPANSWPVANGYKALQIGSYGAISEYASGGGVLVSANSYAYALDSYKYINSYYATMYQQNAGTHRWFTAPSGTAGSAISFSESMRIDSSGNVGVGTSTPSARIHAYSTSTTSIKSQSSGDYSAYFLAINSGGNFYLASDNSTGAGFGSPNGVSLYSDKSGPMTFWQNNTERMRIDANGNLLVGSSSNPATACIYAYQSINAAVIHGVSGNANFTGTLFYGQTTRAANSGFDLIGIYSNSVGQFRVSGTGVIYAQNTTVQSISDIRLKENIKDAKEGLDVICSLRPVRYDWKTGYGNDQKNQLGFIAQEVESVFPEAVSEWQVNKDDETIYKTIGQSAFIPLLVKAIQELKAEVDSLKAQLNK